jgi:mannose-6-phosphate isomerase
MSGVKPYPLAVAPEPVAKVWGGRSLARMVDLPDAADDRIGEVWCLSALRERPSRVTNGALAGERLDEALARLDGPPAAVPFPVLVKFLEVTEPISLQVHPGDAYARKQGHPNGKCEAWLVLKAAPGACVIHGLKSPADPHPDAPEPPSTADLAAFARALREDPGSLDAFLRRVAIKEGDVIPVPPGTVHSTSGELVVVEVQQTSDLTYRLHDWGRGGPGRELALDHALAALAPRARTPLPLGGLTLESGPATRRLLFACRPFVMEEIHVVGSWSAPSRGHAFEVLTGLKGKPQVECGGDVLPLPPGRSVLVPHGMAFGLVSRAAGRVLRVYQADLEAEVRTAALAAGHPPERVDEVVFAGDSLP